MKPTFIAVTTPPLITRVAKAAYEIWNEHFPQVISQAQIDYMVERFQSEARIAGRLNAELLNNGTPVSITDVWIAATGLRHGWTVVTSNVRDFARIKGLRLENWR